jgi:hypothetical protein
MIVRKLPNDNLIIPFRCEGENGDVIGDSIEEITPKHPEYQAWLKYINEHSDEVIQL